MMRAALFGVAIAAAITRPAAATDYFREELRIPMAAAGPLGLEALLIRPSEAQRYPLAVISHGTSADGNVRQALNPWL